MSRFTSLFIATSLCLGVTTAQAHRVWVLPAMTVLSGNEQWVSFEAAVSNNLFFPNHRAVQLKQIEARAPDGSPVELKNATSGEVRSSFELHLQQQGTYVVSLLPGQRRPAGGGEGNANAPTLMGSYEENGKPQRWRGTPESLVSEGMSSKPGFKLRESGSRRVLTFVTLGKPSQENLKTTGQGLEAEYLVHPNDLTTGEPGHLRFLVDGKPQVGVEVAVVRGDDRFRDEAGEVVLKSDAQGEVKIEWPQAGRYWVEASFAAPGQLHGVPSEKNHTYIVVLEVLPQ